MEFLFRGKTIDREPFALSKWVYGNVRQKHYTDLQKPSPMYILNTCDEETWEVITESVGQFTGLFDKNGKQIFYKDIIRCYLSDGKECKHLIRWVDSEAAFVAEKEDKDGFWRNYGILDYCKVTQDWITKSEKEVIGNAIDNPELMIYFTK